MKTLIASLISGLLAVSVGAAQPLPPQEFDPAAQVDMATAALTAALCDWEVAVRQAAIMALKSMGPAARPAIPALAHRLRDPDGYLRIDAAHVLAGLRADAVPVLTDALFDPDTGVRELAARTLRQIGPDAKDAVCALVTALRDPDPGVRQSVILALKAIGPEARVAVWELAQRLRDRDGQVRIDAANTLVRLGPDAIPSLTQLICDPDSRTRELAVQVIGRIGAEIVDSGPRRY